MKLHVLPLIVLAAFPVAAQKEKIAEIQRDMLLMQDQIRALQRSQDEKLAAMQVLLQQTLEAANKANTAVAVLDSALTARLKEQEKMVGAPVANLGSKVDTMANDFAGVRESITDLSARLGKLQNQITDINSAIKTLQAPPAPPPPPAAANPNGPPAGVTAESLYNSAMRDKTAGNSDLAIEGYQSYLKWFGNTDLAPNAQYYIGEVKYLKGDYDGALQAFDTLLEKYPDNAKTCDAMLQKGRALVKAGFKAEARQEFTSLIKKFPTHENASKAKTELAALGVPARAPARNTRKR
ncbi:MAG: tetratricopeptide repeat protein [Acidobacteria bacterium]|nr:tetratricopeptide repeat protein [Acidobacteriota bacterium]